MASYWYHGIRVIASHAQVSAATATSALYLIGILASDTVVDKGFAVATLCAIIASAAKSEHLREITCKALCWIP